MLQTTHRRAKIKKTIRGTQGKPRLVIYRSNRYFYAQLVNDAKGTTLASVNKLTDPVEAGTKIGELAGKLHIKTVVFDRAGRKYHGNVKKLADATRAAGLTF